MEVMWQSLPLCEYILNIIKSKFKSKYSLEQYMSVFFSSQTVALCNSIFFVESWIHRNAIIFIVRDKKASALFSLIRNERFMLERNNPAKNFQICHNFGICTTKISYLFAVDSTLGLKLKLEEPGNLLLVKKYILR